MTADLENSESAADEPEDQPVDESDADESEDTEDPEDTEDDESVDESVVDAESADDSDANDLAADESGNDSETDSFDEDDDIVQELQVDCVQLARQRILREQERKDENKDRSFAQKTMERNEAEDARRAHLQNWVYFVKIYANRVEVYEQGRPDKMWRFVFPDRQTIVKQVQKFEFLLQSHNDGPTTLTGIATFELNEGEEQDVGLILTASGERPNAQFDEL